jgi:hypothetical protein
MDNVTARRKSYIAVQDSRAGLKPDVMSGNVLNLTGICIGLDVFRKEEGNKLERIN